VAVVPLTAALLLTVIACATVGGAFCGSTFNVVVNTLPVPLAALAERAVSV